MEEKLFEGGREWRVLEIGEDRIAYLIVLDTFPRVDGLIGRAVGDDGADNLSTVGGAGDGGARNAEDKY
jgi:hypothetical protein